MLTKDADFILSQIISHEIEFQKFYSTKQHKIFFHQKNPKTFLPCLKADPIIKCPEKNAVKEQKRKNGPLFLS